MRILFIGDIVGQAGRQMLTRHLDRLVDRHRIDFTVANVENAADGLGVTPEIASEILAMGVDCLTSGNHIWDKRQITDYIDTQPRLLRPINYPQDLPGRGTYLGETPSGLLVGVVNVMGRIFMPPTDDPFRSARAALQTLSARTKVLIVDMHAEATSEKMAMGWYLDGRASAVIGTHTHVPTADERILPGGTAFITDAGMTGSFDSVIGMEKEPALARFLTHMPERLTSARKDARLCGVLLDVDEGTGRARAIDRLMVSGDDA
ncbi:MAG TPA: TIGR00282 family metallophosphoesterase [Candidatus Polarisedimenticolia bacterium]|jgi:hypothetical protein